MSGSKRRHSSLRSSNSRRKKRLRKQLIILLIVAIILGSGYYYLTSNLNDNAYYTSTGDTTSDYTLSENKDSLQYQAIVIYNKNIDINSIANTFYKSDIFWPYIFIENKNVIKNPLNIEKHVVLKIPRLSDSIIDLKNTSSVERVKLLADSILENVKELN